MATYEKGLLGDYPGSGEMEAAEDHLHGDIEYVSRRILAATRAYLRESLAKVKAGERDFGLAEMEDESYWDKLLRENPHNKNLLILHGCEVAVKKIASARYSDTKDPSAVLEAELRKLDEAFGPETEEGRDQLFRENWEDLLPNDSKVVELKAKPTLDEQDLGSGESQPKKTTVN